MLFKTKTLIICVFLISLNAHSQNADNTKKRVPPKAENVLLEESRRKEESSLPLKTENQNFDNLVALQKDILKYLDPLSKNNRILNDYEKFMSMEGVKVGILTLKDFVNMQPEDLSQICKDKMSSAKRFYIGLDRVHAANRERLKHKMDTKTNRK